MEQGECGGSEAVTQVELPLRSRSQTYFLLVGVVVGLLVAGLLVPLVFGTPSTSVAGRSVGRATGSGPATASPEATVASPTGVTGSTATGAPGPGASPAKRSGGARGGQGAQEPAAGTVGAIGSAAPSGVVLRDSDIGVKADTVKLGLAIIDLGGVNSVGVNVPGVDPELQKRAWSTFIAATNAAGGILGRKVTYVFDNYDVLRTDDQRRSCLKFTQDERVFAALDAGGLENKAALCFAEENRTPLVMLGSQGIQQDTITRSDGLLFTLFPSSDRTLADLAWELAGTGVPKTAKIGIVADDRSDPGLRTVDGVLAPTLQSLGYQVVYRTRLSEDVGVAASQMPLEVQQMQAKGADQVLLITGVTNANNFVQTADSRGWRPSYSASDFASAYSDTWGANMPASFQGSRLFTTTRNNEWRLDIPMPAYDAECKRRYEQGTGQTLDRSSIAFSVVLRICTIYDAFLKAATKAGPDLTRKGLSAALQGLGEIPMGTFFAGAWGPGKFDAANYLRTAEWRLDCKTSPATTSPKCWLPRSDFRRTHF